MALAFIPCDVYTLSRGNALAVRDILAVLHNEALDTDALSAARILNHTTRAIVTYRIDAIVESNIRALEENVRLLCPLARAENRAEISAQLCLLVDAFQTAHMLLEVR